MPLTPTAPDVDIYGIPAGGTSGAYSIRKWKGLNWALTWEEMIATVALGGWPHAKWAEAAATAASESSRNPFIYNTYKKGHFGLFQISRSAHPEFFTGTNSSAWVVPPDNAAKGYEIYQSEGWGAWEAHTSGTYLANLAQAKAAVIAFDKKAAGRTGKTYWESLYRNDTKLKVLGASLAISPQALADVAGGAVAGGIGGGAEGAAGGVVAAGDATVSAVGQMGQVVTGLWTALTTPAFWMRVAYGVTGIALVGGGLFLMVRNTSAGQAAGQTVTKAVKGVVS